MKLLLLDDDELLLKTMQRRFSQLGHQVVCYSSLPTWPELIACQPDACLIDLRYGTDSGLQLLEPLRTAFPDAKLVVLTGYASIATAVQAVKLGADDYLTKPVDFNLLQLALGLSDASTEPSELDIDDLNLLSTDQIEWEHIQRVLTEQQGNISLTAKLLGMHRRTLQRKLAKHRPG